MSSNILLSDLEPVQPTDPTESPDRGQRDLSAELATPSGDFLTQIDINHILGNLFEELAANRVSTKRASALAYICCNLIKSQEGMHDQVRFMELTACDFLHQALQKKYFAQPANIPRSPNPLPDK